MDKEREKEPGIIIGSIHVDDRGVLKHFNNFDLGPVKRFYILEQPDIKIVKAWQGHQKESKWFYVINGEFKIILVKPDDWLNPKPDLNYQEFIIKSKNNEILHIPAGHVTGFKALSSESRLVIFSDKSLEESLNDDYRFPKELWYNW